MRSPALAVVDVDDLPGRLDRLHERRRDDPPPPTSTSTVVGSGSWTTSTSRGTSAVSRRPASRTTTTRRSTRKGGVRQASTTAPTSSSSPASPSELLDDERVVAVAHHVVEQRAYLLGHQRRVVALDEVGRARLAAAHSASLTAASTSRARQVPLTSCTRTIRQPQAMPSAAAPMEASRRSVSSKSSTWPRKVLLEAESNNG